MMIAVTSHALEVPGMSDLVGSDRTDGARLSYDRPAGTWLEAVLRRGRDLLGAEPADVEGQSSIQA